MQRRKFVLLSAFGAAAMVIPTVNCRHRYAALRPVLVKPLFLSKIMDARGLAEVGKAYRTQTLAGTNSEQLENLLLTDPEGSIPLGPNDSSLLQERLELWIRQDFAEDKTVTVKGWILSTTEAIQCALFSYTTT